MPKKRKHQHDIKGTWKVLNSLIKKGRSYKSIPDSFVCGNQILTANANGFNDFFVNVGPHLARKIKTPLSGTNIHDYMHVKPNASMFLHAADEQEVLRVVNNFKGKYSTDNDGIDKTVIVFIVKPLTQISNRSF